MLRKLDRFLSGIHARGNIVDYHLDVLSKTQITGWAWFPSSPRKRLRLEFLVGQTVIGETVADLFRDEAEERWGGTPEWEQSQATQSKMTDQDWESVKREQDEFVTLLADAADRRVEPGSAEAAAIVERHRASIGRFYAVSREKQVLLARM